MAAEKAVIETGDKDYCQQLIRDAKDVSHKAAVALQGVELDPYTRVITNTYLSSVSRNYYLIVSTIYTVTRIS